MAWALDLDGVVWLGDHAVPGAAAAVARLREAGEQVFFVTNNSGRTVAEVEARLAGFGIDACGGVITSAMATARLVEPGETVLCLCGAGAAEELRKAGANVVAKGAAVRDLRVGELVTAEGMLYCGVCEACRKGWFNQCVRTDPRAA